MKWIKYSIQTTTAAEDFLSAMLADLGVEGIEIQDNVPLSEEEQAEMFIDFPPELGPDDGLSQVHFYLDVDEDHSALLEEIRLGIEEQRQFVDVGAGTITQVETEDIDWMNNWKEFFHAFTIDNILIKPTWESVDAADADKTVIEIDPGSSFGTGKHETTQLCIRALQSYVTEGIPVLDVGCGSGILGIAALKLGAGRVVGTDLDENCLVSSRENFATNHLPKEAGTFYKGNLIDDIALQAQVGFAAYPVVVANILADVIIPMAPALFAATAEDGILITSGIIDFKEQQVYDALAAAGYVDLSVARQGEWVSITGRRPKA